MNTVTMAQKIDSAFCYDNVDNSQWDQEIIKYKKQIQENAPNYK